MEVRSCISSINKSNLFQRTINEYSKARKDYLPVDAPRIYTGNLGNLTDCDSSGIVIGMKVKGATRLGIDLDTIDEINQVNKGLEDELGIDLPIKLKDLEESNSANTRWQGLVGITNRTGKLYESLSHLERDYYYRYLRSSKWIARTSSPLLFRESPQSTEVLIDDTEISLAISRSGLCCS